MDDISNSQLEFGIFCVENIALKLGIRGDKVYKLLTEASDILDTYIMEYYETLHTQSKEYIVNDIIEYMQSAEVLK
ncbi:MAG: DUF3791 domain-containing protein [Clostridium sp.]